MIRIKRATAYCCENCFAQKGDTFGIMFDRRVKTYLCEGCLQKLQEELEEFLKMNIIRKEQDDDIYGVEDFKALELKEDAKLAERKLTQQEWKNIIAWAKDGTVCYKALVELKDRLDTMVMKEIESRR